MLQHVTTTLTVAVLLLCPYSCLAGGNLLSACGFAAEAHARPACCCCDRHRTNPEAPPRDSAPTGGHCLCHGAVATSVADGAAAIDLAPLTFAALPPITSDSAVQRFALTTAHETATPPPPDERQLRALLATFLL